MNKGPKTLIREYYEAHGITHGAPLLFSYVRKNRHDDGAVIEYYAARYGHARGKKGKRIVSKLVMKFNPGTHNHSMTSSAIRYLSYSSLIIDHYVFDFHREMPRCRDYTKECGAETGLNRLIRSGHYDRELMPSSEIPLNDFSGTRYQYCKYRYKREDICNGAVHSYAYWAKNPYGSLPEYLRKFDINPRAMEMFAASGMRKYMKKDFLVRLRDDAEFAKWYKKHALSMLGKPIHLIEAAARKEIGVTGFLADRIARRKAEKERERRRIERQHRADIRRAQEIERKRMEERKNRAKRIRDLYEKLKAICTKYGAYEVRVPKNEAEMKREGERMHNCIGKCYPCRQGIDAIVVFLWRNGKPCVDIEVDPFTFKVVQCRETCNANADEKMHELARTIAEDIRKIYRTRKAA